MMYPDLNFPKLTDRSFFYSNFVETVDGKVQVVNDPKAYWPIGSQTDYETLLELRAYADVLIHGRATAESFRTFKSLAKPKFQQLREQFGKQRKLLYTVVSTHPSNKLLTYLKNSPPEIDTLLTTTDNTALSEELAVAKLGTNEVDLKRLAVYLHEQGYQHILVEGGPNLFGSFLAADLIDEVFVTIAPKIFGNVEGATLTMVEGVLLSPNESKKLTLVSAKPVGDEVYLRYRV